MSPAYSETLNYIYNLRGGEIDLRLARVERALALFGHPQRRYLSFHIAGTNGKGSTAAMIHSMLCAGGYRAALYTSPHLVSFTERIRVGQEEISEEEVVELAREIRARADKGQIGLTFFEFVTVMAFIYFARRKVDVAVVEVGLGGRLDATNLVVPRTCVVTTISRDHEAYLGSDLLSIAREKAGIIKSGVPVICGSVAPDVGTLLKETAASRNSESYFLDRDFSFASGESGLFDYEGLESNLKSLCVALRGDFQRHNASLALAALEVARSDFPLGEEAVREGLRSVVWPGRFEVLEGHPTVVLDGAHNSDGVQTLVREIRRFSPGSKVKLLFGAMADKDWRFMLGEFLPLASEVVLTRMPMARSGDPAAMAGFVGPARSCAVIEEPARGLRFLLERAAPEDIVLVTGSLYLLGEVRPILVGGNVR